MGFYNIVTDRIILACMTVVLCMCQLTTAQKTYNRGCECQYTINGKCAYTLLIPTGQGTGQGTAGSTGSTCPNQDTLPPQGLDAVQNDIAKIKGQIADQSLTLNQLQRSVLHQQELQRNSSQGDRTPGNHDSCPETCQQRIEAQSSATLQNIDKLNSTISAQQKNVDTLSQTVQRVSEYVEELKKASNISLLLNQSRSLEGHVQRLKNTIDNLKKANKLCEKKALMVLGKEHSIPDSSISASSMYDETHNPNRSRLHLATSLNSPMSGAWCPVEQASTEPAKRYEWLQFDLGKVISLLGVVTQGRYDYPQWVAWYNVEYATELPGNNSTTTTWKPYRNIAGSVVFFPGNWDQQATMVNYLPTPVNARYIRIVPTYGGTHLNQQTNRCLRADVIGCLDEE